MSLSWTSGRCEPCTCLVAKARRTPLPGYTAATQRDYDECLSLCQKHLDPQSKDSLSDGAFIALYMVCGAYVSHEPLPTDQLDAARAIVRAQAETET